jgi:type III secretion protein Q
MPILLARTHQKEATELSSAAALPRLSPVMSRALTQLYSRCAPVEFVLQGKTWLLQWCVAPAGRAEHEIYRFRLGSQAGGVGIDASAASTLLGERRSDLLPRELRYLLWANALHALAEAAEAATRLRVDWTLPEEAHEPPPPDPQRAAHFAMQALDGGPRWRGFLQFDEDAALGALVAVWPQRGRLHTAGFDALRLPMPLSLGSTQISLREMRAVRPGDIISIEDWASSGAALRVTARAGGAGGFHFAGLAEGTRFTIHSAKEDAMNRDSDAAVALPGDDEAGQLPLDRLDALEVNLRFEVGDLSLTLGELRSVRAGHVFELAQPLNRSTVRILAHGNVLGKGYLVAIGDKLGVRVSEFAPSEL